MKTVNLKLKAANAEVHDDAVSQVVALWSVGREGYAYESSGKPSSTEKSFASMQ